MITNPELTVLLADPMAGVRDAWRAILAADPGVVVLAEAETLAEALRLPGQVVLAGVAFIDGSVADLIAVQTRPVVVWTVLPDDEFARPDGAAGIVRAGQVREQLIPTLRASI